MTREKIRQILWWIIAFDFPFLYLSPDMSETTAPTIVALAIMALASVLVIFVY